MSRPLAALRRALARRPAPYAGRHCGHAPATPAPGGGPAQAPRPGDPPGANGEVRAGATTPMTPGAVNADSGTRLSPAAPPSQPEGAARPHARPVLPAPAPPKDTGRGEHPYGQPAYGIEAARLDGITAFVDGSGAFAAIRRPVAPSLRETAILAPLAMTVTEWDASPAVLGRVAASLKRAS